MDQAGQKETSIFAPDLQSADAHIADVVSKGKFLVVGGAGSIGQAVVTELLRRSPKLVHVVDLNENNLAELVRSIRSTLGYPAGIFETYAVDFGSKNFEKFVERHAPYDFVLNLAALKHVRSEQDPFTMTRMLEVNVLAAKNLQLLAKKYGCGNYFCVSTDKAANPINVMGATKRLMELILTQEEECDSTSLARFANVSYSDGSLLHSFRQRLTKRQPISAPKDVWRYFISASEAAELCLIATIFGKKGEIFYPGQELNMRLLNLQELAEQFIIQNGFEPFVCNSEDEARNSAETLISAKKWPCFFFNTDTVGEKLAEQFTSGKEIVDRLRFVNIDVITSHKSLNTIDSLSTVEKIQELIRLGHFDKPSILKLLREFVPEFEHLETGKSLHQRM